VELPLGAAQGSTSGREGWYSKYNGKWLMTQKEHVTPEASQESCTWLSFGQSGKIGGCRKGLLSTTVLHLYKLD
jgi:hypothetical protein